jgi:hypothetical protein
VQEVHRKPRGNLMVALFVSTVAITFILYNYTSVIGLVTD